MNKSVGEIKYLIMMAGLFVADNTVMKPFGIIDFERLHLNTFKTEQTTGTAYVKERGTGLTTYLHLHTSTK